MKYVVKLMSLALCATLPMVYASAAYSETTSKKHVVKAKVKKHKVRAKKTTKPRIVARKAASAENIASKPQVTPPVVAASQVPATPATAVVVPAQPTAEPPATPARTQAPVNPYLAQPYAAVKSVNPYMPQPPMPWPEPQVAAPSVANPYLPRTVQAPSPAPQAAAVAPGNPYLAAPTPVVKLASVGTNPYLTTTNPYLTSTASDAPGAVPAQAYTPPSMPQIVQYAPVAAPSPSKSTSPGLLASLDPKQGLSDLFGSVRNSIPLLNDQDLLPTIKKVYPTGEKPLVIISFKCPTEMIGVTPPPMKALHELINFGFEGINKTNMLSFNLQQVCN